jgi:hypothetical protein
LATIATQLGVAKSTASLWVRDVKLSLEQMAALHNAPRVAARGARRGKHTKELRWRAFREAAEVEWASKRKDADFMYGLALFAGEGARREQNAVVLTNSDPRIIRCFLSWIRALGAEERSLKAMLTIHIGGSTRMAEGFWKAQIGPSSISFTKTVAVTSRSSQGIRGNRIPFGTCRITCHSTELRQRIEAWRLLSLGETDVLLDLRPALSKMTEGASS